MSIADGGGGPRLRRARWLRAAEHGSAELAADFLAAYEADAGRRVDPYWDIRSVMAPAFSDWASFIPTQVGSRAQVDSAGMHRRVDDLLAAALRRTRRRGMSATAGVDGDSYHRAMQHAPSNRHRSGKRRSVPQKLTGLVAVLAIAVSGCAAISPSSLDSAAGLVAPSGEILLPPCPASAGCIEGFVVGHTLYGISCHGVETTAVGAAAIARGGGAFREARPIDGVPPDLWLAVRGDLPCLPGEDEPLAYEWYLAQGQTTEADIREWGERVADLTLPIDPGSTDSSD